MREGALGRSTEVRATCWRRTKKSGGGVKWSSGPITGCGIISLIWEGKYLLIIRASLALARVRRASLRLSLSAWGRVFPV
jgi:hypothetical protein